MMKIVEVLGMPPNSLIEAGTKSQRYFELNTDGVYVPRQSKDGKRVNICTKAQGYEVQLLKCQLAVYRPCITKGGFSFSKSKMSSVLLVILI